MGVICFYWWYIPFLEPFLKYDGNIVNKVEAPIQPKLNYGRTYIKPLNLIITVGKVLKPNN